MGDENTIRTFEDYSKPSYEGYRNTIELHVRNNVTPLRSDTIRSLEYENPDIEQLLGVMECKVDTLMKEAISLMEKSESLFGMTSNTVYQLPSEPSRQEEFKNLVMNFILDQEEKVKQLEEYMGVIGSDFMKLSLEVVGKLKAFLNISTCYPVISSI
ncbi:hypothetical protein Tco_0242852 [Tanacetum coccineum]